MKKIVLIFCLSIWTIVSNAQVKYDKVGQFGEFKSDWALVQLNGKKGFINFNGKFIPDEKKLLP